MNLACNKEDEEDEEDIKSVPYMYVFKMLRNNSTNQKLGIELQNWQAISFARGEGGEEVL